MNLYSIDSPNTPFAGGFKVAAAAVVIGLVMAASKAANDEVSSVTLHDAPANAAASTVPDYFPSGYALDATEPASHIEAF